MQRKLLAALVGLSVFVTACGGDDSPSTDADTVAAPDADEPDTGDPAGDSADRPAADAATEATPAAQSTVPDTTAAPGVDYPQAIISLSPTATEMLYAIGAGDQVLAVDDYSNHPAEAAEKASGISGFEPNVEAIVGLAPDLVVNEGSRPDFLDQLDGLGIAHLETPAVSDFEGVYAQIEALGAATGHADEAAALVADMRAEVDAIKAGLPQLDEPLTYYHELDPTLFSVTSATFIGAVYAEVGLVNIADETGDEFGYPQLSAEFIVAADPDLIFLACTIYCGESPESVAARDGWDVLTAVRNGGVIAMNDDIASRWGPRIVDYLAAVGEAVARVAAAQSAG